MPTATYTQNLLLSDLLLTSLAIWSISVISLWPTKKASLQWRAPRGGAGYKFNSLCLYTPHGETWIQLSRRFDVHATSSGRS
jgi:hypothetical protein